MKIGTFVLVAALAGSVFLADATPAFAKSAARAPLAPVAAGALDGAKVRVRVQAKSRGRADLRIDVERAAQGLSLEAWFADAAGTMTFAGDFAEDDTPGEYRFRVRTDKGGTLPGGAATAADLSGRVVEIRDADGNVVAAGTVPVVADRAMPGSGGGRGRGRGADDATGGTSGGSADDSGGGRGADDPAGHDANDDSGGGRGRGGRGGSGRGGADDGPNHQ